MEKVEDSYFLKVEIFMKCFAMWPGRSENKKKLMLRMLLCSLPVCILIIQDFLYLALVHYDTLRMIRMIGILSFHVIIIIRILHWLPYFPKIQKLISQVQRRSFEFKNLYVPPEMVYHRHGRTVLKCTAATCKNFTEVRDKLTEENRRIYSTLNANGVDFSMKIFTAFASSTITIFICAYVPAFTDLKFGNYVVVKGLANPTYHVLNMSDPLQYHMEAVFQLFAFMYSSLVIVGAEACILGIIIHVISQSKIIGYIFKNIICDSDNKTARKQFKKCIVQTNCVMNIINNMDDVQRMVLLLQDLLGVFVICLFIYVTPRDNNAVVIMAEILFLGTVSIEPLVLGWFSQSITDELLGLTDSLYAMNWHDADNNFRRNVLFALRRLQKPVNLTVGNFAPVNLNLAVYILKTAYSFYTLISP